MEQIIIMYAGLMPEEEILDDVQEALTAHKLAPSEQTKNKLMMHLMIFMTKQKINKDGGDMFKTMKDFEKQKDWHKLLKKEHS